MANIGRTLDATNEVQAIVNKEGISTVDPMDVEDLELLDGAHCSFLDVSTTEEVERVEKSISTSAIKVRDVNNQTGQNVPVYTGPVQDFLKLLGKGLASEGGSKLFDWGKDKLSKFTTNRQKNDTKNKTDEQKEDTQKKTDEQKKDTEK